MSTRPKSIVMVATATAAVLFAGTASAAVMPGAAGAGDSYYPLAGNGGYDVAHYDIRLSYQPSTDKLWGTTTILAKATQDLSQFNLDFRLEATSVRVNNTAAKYQQEGGELVVDPKSDVRRDDNLTIVVTYEGVPSAVKDSDNFSAWTRTADGALAIGEPEIAAWWYPSNDHPTDKATFDVSVAVPTGVEVISNGTFRGTTRQINGWTRWNWRSGQPQATYLAFLAIGQFEVRHSTAPNGQPVVNAYSERLGENGNAAKASIERTPELTEFLETQFGPYPFEAQGGVATPDIGYALENQTRSTYDSVFFQRGTNTYVVAHELGHQWYGDSVSVHRWRDIWLNEGFATYAEWLWSERTGEGTAQENADFTYDFRPADNPFWDVLLSDPGVANQFSSAVYDRGALALHALRVEVGDTAFFEILKAWSARKKYGDATTEEFVALAEQISGRQLDAVFQTWLFTTGKPATAPGRAAWRANAVTAEPKSFRKIQETHQLLAADKH